jgi:hypothetical protein
MVASALIDEGAVSMALGKKTVSGAIQSGRKPQRRSNCSPGKRAKSLRVEHNYVDHYYDPICRPGEEGETFAPSPTKRNGPRGGVVTPFPKILHDMLSSVEEEGLEDAVSWQAHGRCFTVHNAEKLVACVLPR